MRTHKSRKTPISFIMTVCPPVPLYRPDSHFTIFVKSGFGDRTTKKCAQKIQILLKSDKDTSGNLRAWTERFGMYLHKNQQMHQNYHVIVMLSQMLLHVSAHQRHHQGARTILTSYLSVCITERIMEYRAK
jgi:exopolyphosphatase/pppGpp-phosphohydrolase